MRLKLITNYKNKEYTFNNEPIRHLIKSCNDEARRALRTIKNRTEESIIVKFGKWTLRINEREMDKPVREAVRIIDAMNSEKQ